MSKLDIILITKKENLIEYYDDIAELFKECFSVELSFNLWKWAYIDNIYGDPLVSMSFADGRLVGHYAAIPIFLINQNKQILKSALSMTSMVAKSHRKLSLFLQLANTVYSELEVQKYDLIYGFPNRMSAPLLQKALYWQLPKTDYIANVSKKQLSESKDLIRFFSDKNKFGFNVYDPDQVNWRLSNKDKKYNKCNYKITKEYNEGVDLMYLIEDTIEFLDPTKKYNVLLDSAISDLLCYKISEYQFGYKIFNRDISTIHFDKSMMMADIF